MSDGDSRINLSDEYEEKIEQILLDEYGMTPKKVYGMFPKEKVEAFTDQFLGEYEDS